MRITDTVYFKHKNLTQPTLTQQDRIVKAIQDLSAAITGKVKHKLQWQYDAIKRLTDMLKAGKTMPVVLTGYEPVPGVHKNKEEHLPNQVPKRVQFAEQPEPRVGPAEPNRLIVVSPTSQLQPILKEEPKYSKPPITTSESVASRVKSSRANLHYDSIASRVAARRQGQEVASPVLDCETGQLLEY